MDVQEVVVEVVVKANDVMILYHLSGYPIAHTLEMLRKGILVEYLNIFHFLFVKDALLGSII